MSFHDRLKKFYLILNGIGIATTFLVMLLVCAEVIGRYLFNSPITGTLEIVEYAIIVIFFPGLAWVQANNLNIEVTLVSDKFSPRTKIFIEGLVLFAGFVILGLMVWQTGAQAVSAYQMGLRSENVKIPAFYFKAVIPFCCFFLSLEFLLQFIEFVARHSPFHFAKKVAERSDA
jgi:TRAP-type C4-dicarboxylate transport system permease small subunit